MGMGVIKHGVTVELSQGIIQGKVDSTVSGVAFYSFQGIPYAQPPVGDLRFKAPQGAPSWEGVKDASSVGSSCSMSEDFLYINVYSPQLPSGNETNSLLPVMVWIHGGGFNVGSGSPSLYGPGFLLEKEILLVTFNYRLGALGFLGLSHSEVSLNNGLKDQRAALRWVQQNIERFGRDPTRVTLFGESAGGVSIEYQLISPSTSGLFQRAISGSGSVLNPWAYVDHASAQTRAQQLAKLLGCTVEDNNVVYNFLMEASSDGLVFLPTVEDETGSGGDVFLPATPLEILKSGNFNHVPYITGFCSLEGKAWVAVELNTTSALANNATEAAHMPPVLWDELNNNFESFLPYDLNLTIGTNESQQVAALVKKFYFGNETASLATIEHLVNVWAVHGDDLNYLFTTTYFNYTEFENNSTEMKTVRRMVTLWTNFAKSQELGEGLDLTWNPIGESKQTYLDINTELSVQNLLELHPERSAFWDGLYSEVDN
uniref:Carboxylesterase type B domain-containing protein n=1 Tax=Timema douglasi TaxID=61478 RepID=A0A7R8Z6W9_TIMDO|nr:unnamed protein product [Timema douglasi]